MSVLNYLLIVLAIIIPGGIPLYLYWRWRTKKFNEAEEQLKTSINNFTDALVEAAQEGYETGMQDTEIVTAADGTKYKTAKNKFLTDSRYLITLITAIIKKEGSLRLSEEDFVHVTGDDYISLYIDLKTNDIVLKAHSSNKSKEIAPYVATTTDEDIFH
tara:strand:- start:189 stop:665 length:477 start_codon:yes stop_codon:yes gene_type:complete